MNTSKIELISFILCLAEVDFCKAKETAYILWAFGAQDASASVVALAARALINGGCADAEALREFASHEQARLTTSITHSYHRGVEEMRALTERARTNISLVLACASFIDAQA